MCGYITVKEAAEILGVSETTIRNFVLKRKLFKAKRIGKQLRIMRDSFLEYLDKAELD